MKTALRALLVLVLLIPTAVFAQQTTTVSGTISAVATSTTLAVQPGGAVTVTLTIAEAESFKGIINIDRSNDGGGSWAVLYSMVGTADVAVGTGTTTNTYYNETTRPSFFRVRCSQFILTSNNVTYALTPSTLYVLDTIARDKEGRGVLGRRGDGLFATAEPFGALGLRNFNTDMVLSTTAGVTTNYQELRSSTISITVPATAFKCGATTCDLTIITLPPRTKVLDALARVSTQFACAATCTSSTLSLLLGYGSGGSELLASMDADGAVALFGDADNERGTVMTRAAAIGGGTLASFTADQAVVLRLTSQTGNVGNGTVSNLNAGSVTVYLTVVRF